VSCLSSGDHCVYQGLIGSVSKIGALYATKEEEQLDLVGPTEICGEDLKIDRNGIRIDSILQSKGITMGRIRGNNDGPNGRNESYRIGSRPHVPRPQAVREVKAGKHPGNHVVKINGREYVRDNPDASTKDNVNQD